MTRVKNCIKYFKNNRIKEYEKILKLAKEKDYETISLKDFILSNFDQDKKILILRHDVDHTSNGAKMMFEVEKKYKSTSSFYFRNKTIEPNLMQEIEKYGSEASLHFEQIADFVKENPNIKTNFKQICIEKLKQNLLYFRNELKLSCLSIASHGEYENTLVQTPNNFLTEDTSVYDFLEIKLEAYNKDFISQITCYISDCPIEQNGGYRYGVTPLEALEKNEKFICFLTHPNHWHYSKWQQFRKMVKSIIKKPITEKESFKRI